jgi:hypothetical protein
LVNGLGIVFPPLPLGFFHLRVVFTVDYIRLLFAYNIPMFPTPSGRKVFVVTCKRCRRDIQSGVREFPFHSITVGCPLCGELRRYLPSEVFLGKPHHLVAKQARSQVR